MEISNLDLFLNGFTLIKATNYIDPGSASAIMAMIIGAIAGVGMTLKLYWFKIKEKISRN
jgi:hypothetical protein|tara:strand:- start:1620 stop:1799 length:180 start_codon:yes stop_codon:yes gene_type:complete